MWASVRVQYASDLHLEYPRNREFLTLHPIVPVGDILILAGDIVSDKHREKIEPLYAEWRTQFKYIISIPGNHEFYGGNAGEAYPGFEAILAPNHFLVNNRTLVLDGVRFIASILWTEIPPEMTKRLERASNDYRQIKFSKQGTEAANLTAAEVNEFHRLSREFLATELKTPFAGRTVVVTHHVPSYSLLGFAAYYSDVLKYYCASNLNKLIKDTSADYWIFGHFHQTVEKKLHGTAFVSNPLGYMTEEQHREFSPTAHFTL